jgi:hypothetical protein
MVLWLSEATPCPTWETIMRNLLVFLGFFGLALSASAASNVSYDVYVLACDGATDCQRVAEGDVVRDGVTNEFVGPGVSLRFDTLTSTAEADTVRLSVNLVPRALSTVSLGAHRQGATSRFGFLIEPCLLKLDQYTSLGTFSDGRRVYQVWGRMLTKRPYSGILASR